MQATFWKDKRVFLTGHTGFKGSWLAFWLDSVGARVTGFSLNPIQGALYGGLEFHNLTDVRGDIRDKRALSQAFEFYPPDIVLHLASKGFIAECLEEPGQTFDINVNGTANLLDCIRKCPSVRATVVVTSDKAYFGDCGKDGFTENHTAFGGMEPYSGSKSCQEIVVDAYRNSYLYDIGVATARASNTLGGGDPFRNRLIPSITDAFAAGRTVEIRNPLAVRPWQNILDCLDGYMTLAQSLYEAGNAFSGAWNFGPDRSGMQTVEWIVREMADAWGEGADYKITEPGVPLPEKDILRLDITKSTSLLSWKPRWSLIETIRQIIKFEKGYAVKQPVQSLYKECIQLHERVCIQGGEKYV